jgi:hypothetical protein
LYIQLAEVLQETHYFSLEAFFKASECAALIPDYQKALDLLGRIISVDAKFKSSEVKKRSQFYKSQIQAQLAASNQEEK